MVSKGLAQLLFVWKAFRGPNAVQTKLSGMDPIEQIRFKSHCVANLSVDNHKVN